MKQPFSVILTIAILFLLAAMLATMLPRVGSPPAAKRTICLNQLRQIGFALEDYHAVHGRYPPVNVADETGKPLYSWRVLILPFLEQDNLYESFNLDEPWDSPTNKPLSEITVEDFRCPSAKSKGNITCYVVATGPNTPWPVGKSLTRKELEDANPNTVWIFEVADSGIPWSKPQDLVLSEMTAGINTSQSKGISSNHLRGANVCCIGAESIETHFLQQKYDSQWYTMTISHRDGDQPLP